MADHKQAVVLIEDADEAEFVSRLLGHQGIPAAPAVDVSAAIETLKTGEVGSLVVGMRLGRESGLDVVERVRKMEQPDAATVPAVVIAEATRSMDRLRAWEKGADAILTKPFHFDELVDALTSAASSAPAERNRRRREAFEMERKRVAQERRR